MKCLNQRTQSSTLIVVLSLLTIISIMLMGKGSFAQEVDRKYAFISIFKDTLLQPIQESEMEICLDVFEKELRSMVAKDSIISLNSTKDTIWSFDTTISGRRLYGTVFSGPLLTSILKESFSDNIIHLYSSAELHTSRLLKGLLIYNSEEAGWKFRAKTE